MERWFLFLLFEVAKRDLLKYFLMFFPGYVQSIGLGFVLLEESFKSMGFISWMNFGQSWSSISSNLTLSYLFVKSSNVKQIYLIDRTLSEWTWE